MALILEIWLNIKARKKGRKALPLAPSVWRSVSLIGDFTPIVIMARMSARAPQGVSAPSVPVVTERPMLPADRRAADLAALDIVRAPTVNR